MAVAVLKALRAFDDDKDDAFYLPMANPGRVGECGKHCT